MDENVEKLSNLVLNALKVSSPILSGNMSKNINISKVEENEITIVIDPKFYDIKKFGKTGKIVFTGPPRKHPTWVSYAMQVDKAGAFGMHNKSEKWATNTCINVAETFANEIEGEFRNEL